MDKVGIEPSVVPSPEGTINITTMQFAVQGQQRAAVFFAFAAAAAILVSLLLIYKFKFLDNSNAVFLLKEHLNKLLSSSPTAQTSSSVDTAAAASTSTRRSLYPGKQTEK